MICDGYERIAALLPGSLPRLTQLVCVSRRFILWQLSLEHDLAHIFPINNAIISPLRNVQFAQFAESLRHLVRGLYICLLLIVGDVERRKRREIQMLHIHCVCLVLIRFKGA